MNDLQLTLPEGIHHSARGVSFPVHMNQEQWLDYGRFLSRAKDGLIFWYTSWRDEGRKRFGDDFVRESMAQFEFEFSTNKKAELLSSLAVRDPELTAEHHFILGKAKLDQVGLDMWVGMAKKEGLSANELQESIRVGRVVRTDSDKQTSGSAWGGGFATVQGIARQWSLLTKQIGELWHEWTPKEIAEFRTEIADIIAFDSKLQSESIRKTGTQEIDEGLIAQCIDIILQEKRASTSLLQRRLRLGYTRASDIMDVLEQRGIVGPGEGAQPREILAPKAIDPNNT